MAADQWNVDQTGAKCSLVTVACLGQVQIPSSKFGEQIEKVGMKIYAHLLNSCPHLAWSPERRLVHREVVDLSAPSNGHGSTVAHWQSTSGERERRVPSSRSSQPDRNIKSLHVPVKGGESKRHVGTSISDTSDLAPKEHLKRINCKLRCGLAASAASSGVMAGSFTKPALSRRAWYINVCNSNQAQENF